MAGRASGSSSDPRRLCADLRLRRRDGLRLNECLLRWSEVDWDTAEIRKPGKGGKCDRHADRRHRAQHPMAVARAIIPSSCSPIVAARALKGRGLVKGERYPITYQGLKTAWRRLRAKPGVQNFRFHDFRHNVGTKLSARDRQPQAGAEGAQPRRSQDDGALRACVGRRRGRGDAALPRAKLRRAPHNFAHNKRAGSGASL